MAKTLSAHVVFYPAAALYAAVVLPWSVLGMTGAVSAPASIASPLGHAHEMLFGFALAAVAGNQLGARSPWRMGVLFAAWLFARVAFLFMPSSILASVLDAAFALALVLEIAPRLFRSAKKLRSYALPSILVAIGMAAAIWALAGTKVSASFVRVAVALFALLLLFMGGRIVGPFVAGYYHRQGDALDSAVQPRLEAATVLAGALAVVAFGWPRWEALGAAACAAAAALAVLRIVRWRIAAIRGRPDLLCLGAGYAWLAIGLAAWAVAIVLERGESAVIHVMTIGALGTLTFNVMAQTWMLRARRVAPDEPLVVAGTFFVAAAVAFRLLGAFASAAWLTAATACWSAAYVLLLAIFWRHRRRR